MRVEARGLTANQVRFLLAEVGKDTPKAISSNTASKVTFNGSAAEARAALHLTLTRLREASGGGTTAYRNIAKVRDMLDDAVRNGNGKSATVVPVENGANVTGDVPPVLAGKAVASAGTKAGTKASAKTGGKRASTPEPEPEPIPLVHPETPARPAVPYSGVQNYRELSHRAKSQSAREFWEQKAREAEESLAREEGNLAHA